MKTAIIIVAAVILLIYIIETAASAYIRSDSMELFSMANKIPTTASVIRGLSILLLELLVATEIILILILIL